MTVYERVLSKARTENVTVVFSFYHKHHQTEITPAEWTRYYNYILYGSWNYKVLNIHLNVRLFSKFVYSETIHVF